jgi:hypothetical protein
MSRLPKLRILPLALLAALLFAPLLSAKDFKLINSLPQRLTEAKAAAQKGWDSGVTATMKNATYQYNNALGKMITDLIQTYYPKDFVPKEDIQNYLKALYTIHRFKQDAANPSGESQGTMAGLDVLSEVSTELEQTVADMVEAILTDDPNLLQKWQKKWEAAKQ